MPEHSPIQPKYFFERQSYIFYLKNNHSLLLNGEVICQASDSPLFKEVHGQRILLHLPSWSIGFESPKSVQSTLWFFSFEVLDDTVFLKNMGQPRPLFCLFLVFSNKHYNFYSNMCESIQCGDTNLRRLGCESPPLTTRPELSTM